MNEYSQQQIQAFFDAISPWRAAYQRARLHFLAVRDEGALKIVAARIYMDAGGADPIPPLFQAGLVVAGVWELPQDALSVEALVASLFSETGFRIEAIGCLRLQSSDSTDVFASSPTLLHPEGLSTGNRLAVLHMEGENWLGWLGHPATDWLLKAAATPYESLQELCFDYRLGKLPESRSTVEVVARTVVEVFADSWVRGDEATLGVWIAKGLDHSAARIGYRVMDKGKVVLRDSVAADGLTWKIGEHGSAGIVKLTIPAGAAVQSFASYAGHAHHVQWHADPDILQNSRATVLSLIDARQQTIRAYLQPEQPLRRTAADDFEAAVSWLLWGLGFSVACFGTNSKTRDALDLVAVSPNGDYLLVECTLGLLRAESKLSRLVARTASLRSSFDSSNMKHVRLLPVMVTALATEQAKADIPAAEENAVLVLTKEHIDRGLEDLLRFPDADSLFQRAFTAVAQKQASRLHLNAPAEPRG